MENIEEKISRKSRGRKERKEPFQKLDQEFKIFIKKAVTDFLNSPEETYTFPPNYSKEARAFIHNYIKRLGLQSKSFGNEPNRYLKLFKQINTEEKAGKGKVTQTLELTDRSREAILNYLRKSDKTDPKLINYSTNGTDHYTVEHIPILNNLPKNLIPPEARTPKHMKKERSDLPIAEYRNEILGALKTHRVIIINGELGSGKTTQVPQYVLEESSEKRNICRIICTQPRRIAAVSIAQRVATERGEQLGGTVGYQIRLERCLNKRSNLIYSTSGCLLRSLMTSGVSNTFKGFTHIFIDEVHERDKNTEFLLISIRDYIARNRNPKVILMSATMDIKLLSDYFGGVPVINVPGKCYPTNIYHLEEILYFTGYKTIEMEEDMKNQKIDMDTKLANIKTCQTELDEESRNFIDNIMDNCLVKNEYIEDNFAQLVYMIAGEGIPIDVRHSKNGKTPLICAAQMNLRKYVCEFIKLEANVFLTDNENLSATDYANMFLDKKCIDILAEATDSTDTAGSNKMKEDQRTLLDIYLSKSKENDEIDHKLLVTLLAMIHKSFHPGSILVFLPGYSDIIIQSEMIYNQLPMHSYKLLMLHSNMNIKDQKEVLMSSHVRKIILSTNISETSITFSDVAFVVDTGKVKKQSYDAITGSTYLKSMWVSQSCAKQRTGRAGRTQEGYCYRMYSEEKYESMEKFMLPEFLRIPLTEICLYTRVIDKNSSVSSYLAKALQPPAEISVTAAIQKLIAIGAFDEHENITELGGHLVDMPLDVQLGKMVIYSILFGCLDPILTITAYHSVKEPFQLPSSAGERTQASERRKAFFISNYSDEAGILNVFRQWEESKRTHNDSKFCRENYLTKSLLEMIGGVRKQILQHIQRKYPALKNLNEFNQNSRNWNVILTCIGAALYPNVCFVNKKMDKLKSKIENGIRPHISSVLRAKEKKKQSKEFMNKWIVFFEKTRTSGSPCIHYNTLMPSIILILFGEMKILKINKCVDNEDHREDVQPYESHSQQTKLSIDKWIEFDIEQENDELLVSGLRRDIEKLLGEFLHHGRILSKKFREDILLTLKKVLLHEIGTEIII